MKDWLSQIDQAIRAGQGRAARKKIEARLEEPIERPWLADLAALCRRTGMPQQSVRLLSPWVRPKVRAQIQATPVEIAEYAAGLIQIGAQAEGLKLLSTLDPRTLPRIFLFQSLAFFSQWEYEAALPLLEKYVAHSALTPYERRVGQVNLVAAQVATRRIAPLLPELIAQTFEEGLRLLHANCLEIQAQSLIEQGLLNKAHSAIEEASQFIQEMDNADALFIKKWRAILAFKEQQPDAQSRLLQVQNEAQIRGQWETMRDCDFYLGRLEHLYFGTPFQAYRNKIFQKNNPLPKSYDWRLEINATHLLDLESSEGLKPGQVLHRLILALSRDFYRPVRLAALHAALFPERHYHPVSSPTVIHQAIKRLRAWARDYSIPLEVIHLDDAYRLSGSVILRVQLESGAQSDQFLRLQAWLKRLSNSLPPGVPFGHAEAMKAGGLASRSTHRILSEAVHAGYLQKIGVGRATQYLLVSK